MENKNLRNHSLVFRHKKTCHLSSILKKFLFIGVTLNANPVDKKRAERDWVDYLT